MGFLNDKNILVTGVVSKHSIAFGVACACRREGANVAFSCQNEKIVRRIQPLLEEAGFKDAPIFPCDVTQDDEITSLFAALRERRTHLDGLVHAIAFAPVDALCGGILDGLNREAFRIAHEVSSYSFPALAKAALPMMAGRNASLLTLSYLGAKRSMPHYNVMGLAKASLESATRYLAHQLGAAGIRVNTISAGIIKTFSSTAVADFAAAQAFHARHAPLRRNVTAEEVGNAAAFLLSDLASGITGTTLFVDAGAHSVAVGQFSG